MISNQSNKRRVESFVVNANAGDTGALYNTAGSGNPLTNASGNVVLANGQLGVFAVTAEGTVAPYVATDTTPTIQEAPVISIFQGTADSAAVASGSANSPLWVRPYERLGDIDGRQGVSVRYQVYQAPTFDVSIIGYDGSAAGAINVLDNTEYTMRLAFRGRIMDEFYNPEGAAQLAASITTPDFTTLGTAEPADWIIQYMTWNLNRNSSAINIDRPALRGHYPFIALALDTTSTAGTDANALSPGFFPVLNTASGTKGLTLTANMITSIQNALSAASMPADTGVLTIDLATAGTATGGAADAFLIMGLDRRLAFNDKVPQVKTRVDVGLTLGFDVNTVNNAKWEQAFEGQGTGRQLSLQYLSTQGQRKYNLEHTLDPVIAFPNPFVEATTYSTYSIEHTDSNQIDVMNVSVSPQKGIIAIPSSESTLITAMTTALNAFLASGGNQAVQTS